MINKLYLIFTITVSVCALGCSSVFYYPDTFTYVDTTKLKIQPEDVHFPSEDGTVLHGWYFHAVGKPRGRIVQFHGNGQNLTSHFIFLRHAPEHGFDHFIFDYRGYGESAGKPSPEKVAMDGRAALRWLAAREPKLPLIVLAQSLGGAVALKALSDLDGEVPVRLLVLDSTFTNYRSEARAVMGEHWLTWLLQPIAWLIVDNSQAPPRDLSHLQVDRAIVVHGQDDHVVPVRMGQRLFSQLPEPKEMWIIPGGHHIDFLWRVEYEKRFFAALDQAVAP